MSNLLHQTAEKFSVTEKLNDVKNGDMSLCTMGS